jgi:hypothetical protein
MLAELIDVTSEAKLQTVVLKGPTLGLIAYGDVTLRSFRDFDLLVRGVEVERTDELLKRIGFLPDFLERERSYLIEDGHALDYLRPPFKVELHTKLLPTQFHFAVPEDEIWPRLASADLYGRKIPVLPPPLSYLFLVAHATKHEWGLFRHLCDVAQMRSRLSQSDWKEVIQIATRHRSLGLVSLAERLIERVFGDVATPVPISPRFEQRIERLASIVLHRLGLSEGDTVDFAPSLALIHPSAASVLFWALARESRRDRFRILMTTMTRPSSADRARSWSSYLRRPLRFAVLTVRSLTHR